MKSFHSLLLLICLLTACERRRVTTVLTDKNRTSLAERREIPPFDETKLVEISLPIHVIAYDLTKNPQQTVVSYRANYSITMLHDFYSFDMERLGWRELTSFEATDERMVLLFEKPLKWCVVTIERHGESEQADVTIYLGPKRDSELI
jgi:hypothetical protein